MQFGVEFDAIRSSSPVAKGTSHATLADVTPAVGIANAYDAMHLTAVAISKAGGVDGPKIRQAFYDIDSYDGLIKTYKKPFTAENHDAIGASDYIFTHFVAGEIVPLTQ
jgi:branched-chain amino acid transport system substrate-binding protein